MSDLRPEIITFHFPEKKFFFLCNTLERKQEMAVSVKIVDQISHLQLSAAIL